MAINPINTFTALGTSPVVSSVANFSQLASLGIELTTLNNTQLLIEIQKLFDYQNKERLDAHYNALIKSIMQNEKIIDQNRQLLEQNEKIISILTGGVK